MDTNQITMIRKIGEDDYELWTTDITDEADRAVWEALMPFQNTGFSVRGSLKDIAEEVAQFDGGSGDEFMYVIKRNAYKPFYANDKCYIDTKEYEEVIYASNNEKEADRVLQGLLIFAPIVEKIENGNGAAYVESEDKDGLLFEYVKTKCRITNHSKSSALKQILV